MAEPFLSEIRMMSFNFPPKGWALGNGTLLPINQNQALFSLLLTNYGGDGRVTFGLPNLQGRTPMHMGNGHTLGEVGGEQNHQLSISEIPTHFHSASGSSSDGGVAIPVSGFLAKAAPANPYIAPTSITSAMNAGTLATVGGSQPHPNMHPFLTINFCLALQGLFPSQN